MNDPDTPVLSDHARAAYEQALASDGLVPRDTPAQHLQELVQLGLVTASGDSWLAQAPSGPLAAARHHLQRRETALQELTGLLERAWMTHMVPDVPEWRTGEAAGRVVMDLLAEAHHTVKAFVVPTRGSSEPLSMPDTQPSVAERGVQIYGLYSADVLDDPAGLQAVRQSIASGEQARLLRSVPFTFTLVDSRVMSIIPPYEVFEQRRAVILRNPSLVEAMEGLFNVLWEQGIPLASDADLDRDQQQENRLLVLLAQGHSDRMIARELGISERTLTRRITVLQERLSARSRFQLGYQAARLVGDLDGEASAGTPRE